MKTEPVRLAVGLRRYETGHPHENDIINPELGKGDLWSRGSMCMKPIKCLKGAVEDRQPRLDA